MLLVGGVEPARSRDERRDAHGQWTSDLLGELDARSTIRSSEVRRIEHVRRAQGIVIHGGIFRQVTVARISRGSRRIAIESAQADGADMDNAPLLLVRPTGLSAGSDVLEGRRCSVCV